MILPTAKMFQYQTATIGNKRTATDSFTHEISPESSSDILTPNMTGPSGKYEIHIFELIKRAIWHIIIGMQVIPSHKRNRAECFRSFELNLVL